MHGPVDRLRRRRMWRIALLGAALAATVAAAAILLAGETIPAAALAAIGAAALLAMRVPERRGSARAPRSTASVHASGAQLAASDAVPEDPIVAAMTGRPPAIRAGSVPRQAGSRAGRAVRALPPPASPVSGAGSSIVSRPASPNRPRARRANWVRRLEPRIAVEPDTPAALHDD